MLPFQLLQGWPEQLQSGDGGGHGIAGKAEERHLIADPAVGEGAARFEEQLPEVHLPQLLHQWADPVAVAGGDAARAHHNVTLGSQVLQGLAQGIGLVRFHPLLMDAVVELLQQRCQQGAVAFPDRSGVALLAGGDQLIATD